ncbi:MAG: Sua5/YciO/YrdC/YwlC family protein, partial [Nanoarchaeota archaeon]
MKILDKDQFLEQESFFLGEIKNGKIFIYPTDTIYGIGCIATNSEAIKKIRKIKH